VPLGSAQQDSRRQSGGRDGRQTDAGSPRPPNPGGHCLTRHIRSPRPNDDPDLRGLVAV